MEKLVLVGRFEFINKANRQFSLIRHYPQLPRSRMRSRKYGDLVKISLSDSEAAEEG